MSDINIGIIGITINYEHAAPGTFMISNVKEKMEISRITR